MKKYVQFILLAVMSLTLLAGCGSTEKKEIVVAFLPNEAEGGDLKGNFKTLIEELQTALGDNYEVKFTVADDYAAVQTAIITGTAHLAWESGNTYATGHMKDENVIPIVSYGPNGEKDTAGYPAYIATHIDNAKDFEGKTSEEDKLAVLKGKSFAFVSPTSTSGALFPSTTFYRYFGPNGTKDFNTRNELFTNGVFFSEVQYGQKHQVDVQLINQKKVYAGAFCCGYAEEAGVMDQMYIISESVVPNGPLWGNKKFLTEEEIGKIQSHLVGLTPDNAKSKIFDEEVGLFSAEDVDPDAHLKRFFAVDAEYYNLFYEMNNVK